MSPDQTNPPALSRDDTDQSLRMERNRTDEELSKGRATMEEDADSVVSRARDEADEVLQRARHRADQPPPERPAPRPGELAQERVTQDRALLLERAVADERIGLERDERSQALRELLALERESTDEHLFAERAVSDASLSARDDLMGMVSHDLRGLLGGIALSANLVASGIAEGAAAQVLLQRTERIQRLTARMNRIIGDLVDVTTIQAGIPMVAPALDDANRLVREAADAFQPAAQAKGLTLRLEPEEAPLRLKLDHGRIHQVLENLIGNAVKFTPSGGEVSVRVAREEGRVRFVVSDTGPGIDPAQHEAMFGRFWQADRHDRRGVGLGLYISRAIVESHGGAIGVESEPGRGSTFFFTLPAA